MSRAARTLFLIAAAALGGCASAPYSVRPPARFQGDATFTVTLVRDPEPLCRAEGQAPAMPGRIILGCVTPNRMILPNPCGSGWRANAFAQLFCHEVGHVNDWPGDHPQ